MQVRQDIQLMEITMSLFETEQFMLQVQKKVPLAWLRILLCLAHHLASGTLFEGRTETCNTTRAGCAP